MESTGQRLSRRDALRCMAFGGAGTLFTLSGGVLSAVDLARAADVPLSSLPLFVQISDTHIGFNQSANTDVAATLELAIERINAISPAPALVLHTGDITDHGRAAEFDEAAQWLRGLRIGELHTVPGEHDLGGGNGAEYFSRFGRASGRRGYYSFDHQGVHFVALLNVLNVRPGALGALGHDQIAWLAADLEGLAASTPVVVFAHMPLWNVYQPWGWGTADAEQALLHLRRFASVTILNGHIHQVIQKTEGGVTFHTARSTAYPMPAPGAGAGPEPLTAAPDRLLKSLGLTSIRVSGQPALVAIADTTIG